jgi:HAD superfamily hydrolase (TIGR01549 family)
LLLDFGGVIVETVHRPTWADELAREVYDQLLACTDQVPKPERVRDDIVAGAAAASAWKNAMSRPMHPAEMSARQYWGDYVATDWPAAARELVLAHALPLAKRQGELRSERHQRRGVIELLDLADALGVRVAIVSNALSGVVHRDWMTEHGLDQRVALEVYSDEVGLRKPNPEMIWIATRALGIEPEEAWYVGDNFDRDVVCGRRARVGGTILMEAADTYRRPYLVHDQPDAVVADPVGLRDLLADTGQIAPATGGRP